MLEGVEFNAMQFVGPLVVLIVTMIGVTLIYKMLFSWLPPKIFKLFLGPVALIGAYIWAIPMNLGFHTYFL